MTSGGHRTSMKVQPAGPNHGPPDPKPRVPPLPETSTFPHTPNTLDHSGTAPPDIPDLEDIQFSQEKLMAFIRNRFGGEDKAVSPTPALTSSSFFTFSP